MANIIDKKIKKDVEDLKLTGSTSKNNEKVESWMVGIMEAYREMKDGRVTKGDCQIIKKSGGNIIGKIGNVYFKSSSNLFESTIDFYEKPVFHLEHRYHHGGVHEEMYENSYTSVVYSVKLNPNGKFVFKGISSNESKVEICFGSPENYKDYYDPARYNSTPYVQIESEFKSELNNVKKKK